MLQFFLKYINCEIHINKIFFDISTWNSKLCGIYYFVHLII